MIIENVPTGLIDVFNKVSLIINLKKQIWFYLLFPL
jgi:hypothetical protein